MSLEQSSKTSESIARFSELLRSVLYECNETLISLDKEVALVCNYIDLEKIRFSNHLQVDFDVTGDTAALKIAPMLLFTFVENCFKHGASCKDESPGIKISLKVEGTRIYFRTENCKPLPEAKLPKSGGIGLKNVQKRLDLIYGSNYSLKISDNYHQFIVELSIEQPNGKVSVP
jgi:LytS/YehU family sensor histidine kinase